MMNKFYKEVQNVSEVTDDLSESSKAVVLMRVAIERTAQENGIEDSAYLISRLLTVTLGIMAGKEVAYEEVIDELEIKNMTEH